MSENTETIREEPKRFDRVFEHLEEPIFATSMGVFLLTVLGALMFGGNTEVIGNLLGYKLTYMSLLGVIVASLGLLSIFFIYVSYSKKEPVRKMLWIPALILATAFYLWYSGQASGYVMRDRMVFGLIFSIFLLFYSFSMHRLLELRIALVFALFLSSMLLHMAPAAGVVGDQYSGKYLSALDPYYFYRHANYIFNNEHVPDVETLSYPTDPPSFASSRFLVSVLMGSIATLVAGLGFSTYDVAMIYPGVFAAFSTLLLYLLIRDLFSDMRPYNYAAALLAAFMLMLSPAFAIKAIATNCEDDALGMFLLIASFLLFTISFRKKSYAVSALAGFSFLLLNLAWNGYIYAIAVFGVFACLYSLVNFINKKSCIEHIPYFVIPVFISQLHPFILHARGALPAFGLPSSVLLISIATPIFLSFVLEALRVYRSGKTEVKEEGLEGKVESAIQDNIYLIAGVVFVLAVLFSSALMSPEAIFKFIVDNIQGAKIREIIGMTTAEQAAMCPSFDVLSPGTYASCTNTLLDAFGISIVFGLGMVFVLSYFALARNSMGAVFVLSWSLPMVWGVINKSQYQFTASVPIVALGATIGLALALKKEDFESLRVIPLILLVAIPIFFYFIVGGIPLLGPFGGEAVMYRGIPGDIVYWNPTLQWLSTQPEDSVVLTWWDYGHWITAVSDRTSIADNTKARRFIVQDLAKFHVLIEDEDEALAIARKYNATHVMIDYTMIAKSGAPHFIATSNLTAAYDDPGREGEHMGYGACVFSPSNSRLDPEYVSDGEGGFDLKKTIVFTCSIGGDYREYIGAIVFELTEDDMQVKVAPLIVRNGALQAGSLVSWDAWKAEHKASILGVQPLISMTDDDGVVVDGVLNNVLSYRDNPEYYLSFPTYKTLVYVPEKFNTYMMTSLYLGEYMDQYKQFGLCDPSVQELEHFRLEEGFRGSMWDMFEKRDDISFLGYVRTYEIVYSEE